MNQNIKILILLAFIAKLLISLFIPLTLDEYYYLIWGQNPQLSYFDHPPMVGWLMTVGDFFKNISAGAIRWPFLALSHATVLIWYFILKTNLSQKSLFYFLLVAFLNPLWGSGVFIATPDIPLLFFWSLAILCSLRLYESPSWINYVALGSALGLGFLAKYQIVLFVPCLMLFIYYKKAFKHVLTPKILLSVIAGLIFSLPVLVWNYQNDWASFDFQWNHGMRSTEWKWHWPLEYVLGQLLIIFPFFAFLALKRESKEHPLNILHCFIIFPLLFFLYSSFKSHVEANWAIMVYPTIYALAFIKMKEAQHKSVKRVITFWVSLIVLVLSLVLFSHHERVKKLRLFESSKFDNILVFAKKNDNVLPFSYQLTSYLTFHLKKDLCKFPKYGRLDFFNFKKDCQTLPDHFFYILPNGYTPPIEKDFPSYKIVQKIKIDDKYFSIEVTKK